MSTICNISILIGIVPVVASLDGRIKKYEDSQAKGEEDFISYYTFFHNYTNVSKFQMIITPLLVLFILINLLSNRNNKCSKIILVFL